MNLLPHDFGGHGPILLLFWRPSKTYKKSDTFPLWTCSWTALSTTGPYSTILTTFANLLEIQHFSFMNLLPDGFGRRGPTSYYSDDLHKPILNPISFLHQFAPGRLWRRGPILHYYDNLHKPITNQQLFLDEFVLDSFGSHRCTFCYSHDFNKPIRNSSCFPYEFVPGRLWRARAHIPLFWLPSQTS